MHTHTHPADDAIARVSCVKHRYEDGTQVDLCGLEFVARKGQRIAVLGPNGSGKTTMLFHLLGLLRPQEGIVTVFGADPSREWRSIRKRIGVVLQNVDEQILAPSVYDDVAFSAQQYGLPSGEVRNRTERAMSRMGISHLAGRVPHGLSGGEKRKVVMAGALVMDPELLVLDEPFEGLDPFSRRQMLDLLEEVSSAGTTVILTTHDIDTVPEFADYCYVLRTGGEIALKGSPLEIFSSAEEIAKSNIRPPVLAELFTRLRASDDDELRPALSIDEATEALLQWKRGSARV